MQNHNIPTLTKEDLLDASRIACLGFDNKRGAFAILLLEGRDSEFYKQATEIHNEIIKIASEDLSGRFMAKFNDMNQMYGRLLEALEDSSVTDEKKKRINKEWVIAKAYRHISQNRGEKQITNIEEIFEENVQYANRLRGSSSSTMLHHQLSTDFINDLKELKGTPEYINLTDDYNKIVANDCLRAQYYQSANTLLKNKLEEYYKDKTKATALSKFYSICNAPKTNSKDNVIQRIIKLIKEFYNASRKYVTNFLASQAKKEASSARYYG